MAAPGLPATCATSSPRRTPTRAAATTTSATSTEVLTRLDELAAARHDVRRHRRAAGRVVPRRGLRRRAGRRGTLGGLGRGRARAAGAGAGRRRGGPAGPAHRDPPARRRRPPTAARSPTPTWRSWPRRRTRYDEYVAAVRREYAHLPDDVFDAGRAAVLGALAAKPHLFHTAYAREHWEAPARANLERGAGRPRRLGPGPLPPPQPGRDQPDHQLPRGHRLGAERDDLVVVLGRDVVVVAVEAALGDAELAGELVQLVERRRRWPGATTSGRGTGPRAGRS